MLVIHPGPDSTDELIEALVDANNQIIGADSRKMLEGVIRMADMTAGDVMVPSTRMELVNIRRPLRPDDARSVIDTAHSRLVFEGERENIVAS